MLKGVVRRQREIDPMIDQQLATGWRLARIDSILRAILRAATFELSELPDVPARVVISEYIDVAHAFFEDDEPSVVNGVLDSSHASSGPATLPGAAESLRASPRGSRPSPTIARRRAPTNRSMSASECCGTRRQSEPLGAARHIR